MACDQSCYAFFAFKKNTCPGQFYENLVRHLLISKMTQGCYTHLDKTYVSFVCICFVNVLYV